VVRDCSQALASPSVLCMVRWRLNKITADQVGAGTTLAASLEAGLIEMIRPPWNKMGGRGMMKRWQRVSMDASAEDGITIIRITRGRKGDAMATVESLEWFEPDGHQYTGYAAAQETGRRPAVEVLADFKKVRAVVALESDDIWDPAWGDLLPIGR
jgi:hypothetical protein